MPFTTDYIRRNSKWLISEGSRIFSQYQAGQLSKLGVGMALFGLRTRLMEVLDGLGTLSGPQKKEIAMGSWDTFQEWALQHDNPFIPGDKDGGPEKWVDAILASDFADKVFEAIYQMAQGKLPILG